jgi:hypothetical protein
MAASVMLFVKGLVALISITVAILLVFLNDIITKPIMAFIMAANYSKPPIGMDMIPVIQWVVIGLCVAVGILAIASIWVEIFAEVAYEPGY